MNDLRTQAKSLGLKGYSKMNKTQLTELLNAQTPKVADLVQKIEQITIEPPVEPLVESDDEVPVFEKPIKKSKKSKKSVESTESKTKKSNSWVAAVKIYNSENASVGIPSKNTPEYQKIKDIQKTL
jgi:hypothetical protein